MSRYTGPKRRIARRLGVNIFSSTKDPMLQKRNAPPGMHGAKRKKKSDYGLQLTEQQKLKAVYGMLSQKQLVAAYHKAVKRSQAKKAHNIQVSPAQLFAESLECRLENIAFRLRFGVSIFATRQLVSHGHVLVNGKKVDISSFVVKQNDVISIKPESRKGAIGALIETARATCITDIPDYLSSEEEGFAGKLVDMPEKDSIPYPTKIDIDAVCQFLTHTT
jgi:small subunit ribosomal protein S4